MEPHCGRRKLYGEVVSFVGGASAKVHTVFPSDHSTAKSTILVGMLK